MSAIIKNLHEESILIILSKKDIAKFNPTHLETYSVTVHELKNSDNETFMFLKCYDIEYNPKEEK